MTAVWITIAGLCAGTVAIKAFGPAAFGARPLPPWTENVIALLAPALLGALVVYESTNRSGRGIELDARLAGVAVAVAALALRLPLAVVVVGAAVATAVARAIV
jgi:branched-subunit amino acid transport protein